MMHKTNDSQNHTRTIGNKYRAFHIRALLVTIMLLWGYTVKAQEIIVPLQFNPVQYNADKNYNTDKHAYKTTALSLPFFEDFTGASPIPDDTKWLDRKVYVNNTMGFNPISRGVATFDALNQNGIPYDTVSNTHLLYADSLTSQQIDLSGYQVSDSLYLSFFYQPEGNGFYPEPEDSLMLYLKKPNGWSRVWLVPGERVHEFKQVMIPITDASYFHAGFQFRFVNKASIVVNDDVWNVDYIRLDANRSINDTAVNDVAFTLPATSYLADYTFMPYHQFLADASGARATQYEAIVRNNGLSSQNVNYHFASKEMVTGTQLATDNGSATLPATGAFKISVPSYTNLPTTPQKYHPSVFEHKYYIESLGTADSKGNDTIIHEQNFHNFLAYDDGSAEKSYFLNLFATLPGKIAIEFNLNEPDTLSAVAIYFGRQVPAPSQKYFSIAIYSDIAYGGGADQVLYQEDFLQPVYSQTNNMWVYKLQQPVPIPAGKFYVGAIQPALSGSDSLYYGLDVNRTTDNHVYYNLLNEWKKSNVAGAVMIRPMFGTVYASSVNGVDNRGIIWDVVPNPTSGIVQVSYDATSTATYQVLDMSGRVLTAGDVKSGNNIDINNLPAGTYFIRLELEGVESEVRKLIKY